MEVRVFILAISARNHRPNLQTRRATSLFHHKICIFARLEVAGERQISGCRTSSCEGGRPIHSTRRCECGSFSSAACRFTNRNLAFKVELSDIRANGNSRETRMAAKQKTLDDLFADTLKDIYYAETKILKALPKMAKAAHADELKEAFEKHQRQTEKHVSRLEQVFDLIETPAKGKKCPAIEGIIEEGAEIMKEFKGTPALDAGLVSAAQAVEHYEIARYGTLKRWAEQMGNDDAGRLLDATLAEEKETDAALTELADSMVNEQAQAAE
jgi:ferritin-like metal-binding protein YciE